MKISSYSTSFILLHCFLDRVLSVEISTASLSASSTIPILSGNYPALVQHAKTTNSFQTIQNANPSPYNNGKQIPRIPYDVEYYNKCNKTMVDVSKCSKKAEYLPCVNDMSSANFGSSCSNEKAQQGENVFYFFLIFSFACVLDKWLHFHAWKNFVPQLMIRA
jgi:hypothetical protein